MPVAYTSPVQLYQQRNLPLNLIALILSYIDDLADIARLTRTSRLLYYMTLPRLYERVILKSYRELRYNDGGRPEGYGGGSPFSMGLNGLVTKNYASYVRSWTLTGEWRESDVDDFSRGRVPDNSMMLNIAVRAAMDRMERLESFSWELNTKPFQTIYQGLISRSTLRSLTLNFPSTRIPRPTVLLPPLPNLREFRALNIDPLCYPDDISLLLLQSKNLEFLTLHWSPRMRDVGEESTNLHAYFGRCMSANYSLKLKGLAMYNLFTRNNIDFETLVEIEGLEQVTFINCNTQESTTVFVDDTWRMMIPKVSPKKLRVMRGDTLDSAQARIMPRLKGLECLYLVNNKRKSSRPASINGFSPALGVPPASPSPDSPLSRENAAVAADYLAAITTNLGSTLRHLLLSDQWHLSKDILTKLARACPNLEQLGVALEEKSPECMRGIMIHLPKLWALRILVRAPRHEIELMESISNDLHETVIGFELSRPEWKNLRWLGLGNMVFRCGGLQEGPSGLDLDGNGGERGDLLRVVRRVEVPMTELPEIWAMDTDALS
ncbi:hypothetical protein K490DRAFT_73674 [Saccharata proteae CBS 121410]|uniref:F-box domain-containing protein n=1 Tax=Saccharata proteae CBS 121410 TaxID=1314787 RepID=A0A9P4LWP3_9PEZI|nr:hypothetical protein K490DRAFT_73674 [Saccharata proteae CBS 121410]